MVESMFTPAHSVLAAAVAELRKRAGLTQRQLADLLRREQSYIGRIETGQRRVDLVEWVALCQACGADPEREIARLVKHINTLVPQRGRRR
jgi:transcriptional regulator with XRE-family HTH domain